MLFVIGSLSVAAVWSLTGDDGPTVAQTGAGLPTPSTAAVTQSTIVGPSTTTTSTGGTTTSQVDTAAPAAEPAAADDPLCHAHAELQRAIDDHVPAETAADLEAFTRAGLAFFTEATGLVDVSERQAFRALANYYRETVDFYQARGWRELTLEELVATPPPTPPSGTGTTVQDILEDRCGVAPVVDNP